MPASDSCPGASCVFETKGLMADFARTIPAFVVIARTPALIGCAAVHVARHSA